MAARQTTRNRSLYIAQCYGTFSVLVRRKQHCVQNAAWSFVMSADHNFRNSFFQNYNRASLLDRKFVNYLIMSYLNNWMMETENSALLLFKASCLYFLGHLSAENYKLHVQDFWNANQTVGCNTCHSLFNFYIRIWTSLQNLAHWTMDMEKVSTSIFPPCRKNMQVGRHRTC